MCLSWEIDYHTSLSKEPGSDLLYRDMLHSTRLWTWVLTQAGEAGQQLAVGGQCLARRPGEGSYGRGLGVSHGGRVEGQRAGSRPDKTTHSLAQPAAQPTTRDTRYRQMVACTVEPRHNSLAPC